MRDHQKPGVSGGVLRAAVWTTAVVLLPLLMVLMAATADASAARPHANARAHRRARHHATGKHAKHRAKHKGKGTSGGVKHSPAPAPGISTPAALTAHGQSLKLAPSLRGNTTKSNNWFGYSQGALEQGGKLFTSITGSWTIPSATQHTAGRAEASSDWIGIGGGCLDAACTATDSTLIQTGTEQDVSSSGAASYSAWWELVPAPSITITNLTVHPGDSMSAAIAETVPDSNVWTITLKDNTTGQSFTTTTPYSSTHGTAEWIEETPLEIGTNAGFAALPNLTNANFDPGTVNGASPALKPPEAMDLVDSSGNVIGAPSAPDSDRDGFGACTWAGTCTAPAS